jgi:enoyl-CoA hydratase/carnithine racemase
MPSFAAVRGPLAVGPAWTRWLAYTADEIDAEAARTIGLVQKVVPLADLIEEAVAVVERIAANAPLGVRVAKQFITRRRARRIAGGHRGDCRAVCDRGSPRRNRRVPGQAAASLQRPMKAVTPRLRRSSGSAELP